MKASAEGQQMFHSVTILVTAVLWTSRRMVFILTQAVSYTHLDVYKRQVLIIVVKIIF